MLLRRITAAVLFLCLLLAPEATAQDVPRNIILFVSDGTGPASFTMARDYHRDHLRKGESLAVDGILTGSIRTYASDNRVTDSAAGATAFAAGVKTFNGAIAVDTARAPVGTILEAAERRGMATGLVATSAITHATPAAFSAHVVDRGLEDQIAAQQLTQNIEVLLGGGEQWFLPEAFDGRRDDGRDLTQEAAERGYRVVRTPAELAEVDRVPVLGLFAHVQLDFEIDRDPQEQPSLAAMTRHAIELLEAASDDGFFLMVEGSRIDHAGHDNDAAAHLHDVLAFDEAVAAALDFAKRDGETLIVSTSDHETGGLSLARARDGRSIYAWHPEALAGVSASHGVMIRAVRDAGRPAAEVLSDYAGIDELEPDEVELLSAAGTDWGMLNAAFAEIIGRRALVGWTTGGHTAVDVNLYAFGPGSERFEGHFDNTHIGRAIADIWSLDLEAVTRELRNEQMGSK